MSNPGLTPEWASIVLDSHQKNFADECAICFSEITHDFRVPELAIKAEDCDDVASAGTVQSDDFAACSRSATFIAQPEKASADNALEALNVDGHGMVAGYDMMGTSSPAKSVGSAGSARGDDDVRDAPSMRPGHDLRTDAVADDREGADGESLLRLDDGWHPDVLAEEIMKQPPHLCTKEQLEFLYKTCRCVSPPCASPELHRLLVLGRSSWRHSTAVLQQRVRRV